MRLFHFSDDPNIAIFEPKPVRVPSERGPGRAWLNGPLVWAIDELRQPMYFFPRQCPRILLWPTTASSDVDRKHYWGDSTARMLAYIESAWLDRVRGEFVYRYQLPTETFEDLDDAGMWVSRSPVTPVRMSKIEDLPGELRKHDVELRALDSLLPLKGVWNTSLHASGIRLRNAQGWEPS